MDSWAEHGTVGKAEVDAEKRIGGEICRAVPRIGRGALLLPAYVIKDQSTRTYLTSEMSHGRHDGQTDSVYLPCDWEMPINVLRHLSDYRSVIGCYNVRYQTHKLRTEIDPNKVMIDVKFNYVGLVGACGGKIDSENRCRHGCTKIISLVKGLLNLKIATLSTTIRIFPSSSLLISRYPDRTVTHHRTRDF